MVGTLFRALVGFSLFVLVTTFAILAAPVLLPTLALLTALPQKPGARQHLGRAGQPERITIPA